MQQYNSELWTNRQNSEILRRVQTAALEKQLKPKKRTRATPVRSNGRVELQKKMQEVRKEAANGSKRGDRELNYLRIF